MGNYVALFIIGLLIIAAILASVPAGIGQTVVSALPF